MLEAVLQHSVKGQKALKDYLSQNYQIEFNFKELQFRWMRGFAVSFDEFEIKYQNKPVLNGDELALFINWKDTINSKKIILSELKFINPIVHSSISNLFQSAWPTLNQQNKHQDFLLQKVSFENLHGFQINCKLQNPACHIQNTLSSLESDLYFEDPQWMRLHIKLHDYLLQDFKEVINRLKNLEVPFPLWLDWIYSKTSWETANGEMLIDISKKETKHTFKLMLDFSKSEIKFSPEWPALKIASLLVQGNEKNLKFMSAKKDGFVDQIGDLPIKKINANFDGLEYIFQVESQFENPAGVPSVISFLKSSPLQKIGKKLEDFHLIEQSGKAFDLILNLEFPILNVGDPDLKMRGDLKLKNHSIDAQDCPLNIENLNLNFDSQTIQGQSQANASTQCFEKMFGMKAAGIFKFKTDFEFDFLKEQISSLELNSDLKDLSIQNNFFSKPALENSLVHLTLQPQPGSKNSYNGQVEWSCLPEPVKFKLDDQFNLKELRFQSKNLVLGKFHFDRFDFNVQNNKYYLKSGRAYWNRQYFASDLKIVADKKDNKMYLKSIDLMHPDFHLKGSGMLKNDKSHLVGQLWLYHLEKFLSLLGYKSGVDANSGHMNYAFSWPGELKDFDFNALFGEGTWQLKQGRILGVDSGLGKLLSLLSFESIYKTLTLDFKSLLKKGFSFDVWDTTWAFSKGCLISKNTNINGPSADLAVQGSIDLNKKFMDLNLIVFPKVVAGSLPLAAGLAAGNPAIGAGFWVFDKLTNSKINHISKAHYKILGDFSNPKVIRKQNKKGLGY